MSLFWRKLLGTQSHELKIAYDIGKSILMLHVVGTNAHGYANHIPLSTLPVVHETLATKIPHPSAYICAWTTGTVPIFIPDLKPIILVGHQLASL